MSEPTLRDLLSSTEAGEEITKATLQWHYRQLMQDTARLMEKENIKPCEAEDIDNNVRYMEYLRETIKFFGGSV